MFRPTHLAPLAAATLAALVLAAPAGARTYHVEGRQKLLDEASSTYRMTGDLVGRWQTTEFHPTADEPYFRATGKEDFKGCLDRRGDGSCSGDPSGTLRFAFDYWAQFDGDALVWGACVHPIVGGTGAFTGARGVLTFVDQPAADNGIRTSYIGTITTKGSGRRARASAASARAC